MDRLGRRLQSNHSDQPDGNDKKHLRSGNQVADFLAFLVFIANVEQVKVVELLGNDPPVLAKVLHAVEQHELLIV